MSIAVVTLYDGEYAAIGAVTSKNKRQYCLEHGYDFICHRDRIDKERQPAWSKIPAITAALKNHQWVFWSDADAAIIKPEQRLETMLDDSKDFIFGCDITGLSTGNFFIQNTPRAHEALAKVWDAPDWKDTPAQWEQSRFHKLIKSDWHAFSYSLIGDYINAPPAQAAGKFIVHCWGMHPEARLIHLRAFCDPTKGNLKDGADVWLRSYFGNLTGRFLEIDKTSNEFGPFGAANHLRDFGWDGYYVPDHDYNESEISDANRYFNVISVSMNPPPIGMKFDYVHWHEPNVCTLQAWLPWLRGAVVSCHPSVKSIIKETGFPIELHRTDDIIFLK